MTPPGRGPYGPLGARLAGFIKRNTIHCNKQNMKALGLVVLEKKSFYVFPMTPRGGAHMDPRGTVGRIYKEDHYTLLLTKYESSGPCGFGEEDFFYVFPIVSLWELMTPGAGPFLTPRACLADNPKGMFGRHTKYQRTNGPVNAHLRSASYTYKHI